MHIPELTGCLFLTDYIGMIWREQERFFFYFFVFRLCTLRWRRLKRSRFRRIFWVNPKKGCLAVVRLNCCWLLHAMPTAGGGLKAIVLRLNFFFFFFFWDVKLLIKFAKSTFCLFIIYTITSFFFFFFFFFKFSLSLSLFLSHSFPHKIIFKKNRGWNKKNMLGCV